ncbi:hypothetical protein HHK36_033400 [Tetracentron sinense]|uniref:Protein FAR1-RELATED SEQUENCE n=1 Tax=Tetracentron sinense TaxID=13715 RepID=A0A834Y7L9_TETSI|nr:hypothetical protein HHK36_033400 [Tetracentron sinense]
MSTTQRSESINSFFDKYVQRKTTLKEFIEQYKVALQDRHERESKADFDTWNRTPVLISHSPYEKQMSTVYTHEIFKKFQKEVLEIVNRWSNDAKGHKIAACALEEAKSTMPTLKVLDPHVTKTKEAPKRIKSGIEKKRKKTNTTKNDKVKEMKDTFK